MCGHFQRGWRSQGIRGTARRPAISTPVGEFVIPPQFAGAHGFSSGLALVRLQDGRQAFIRKDGSYAYIAEDGERLTTFQNGFCTARFPDCTRIFDTDFQTVAIQYGGALEIAGATDRYVVLLAASDPDDLFDATFLIVSREGSVTYAAPYAVQGEDETSGTLRMFIPADIRNNLFYALQGDVSSDGRDDFRLYANPCRWHAVCR